MEWEFHPTERALHGQDAKWWIPDAEVRKVMISVDNFPSILDHLREMPEGEVTRKLSELNELRHRFFFQVRNYPEAAFIGLSLGRYYKFINYSYESSHDKSLGKSGASLSVQL